MLLKLGSFKEHRNAAPEPPQSQQDQELETPAAFPRNHVFEELIY